MLLGIYLEEGNYGRSQALLERRSPRAPRKKTNLFALTSRPQARQSTAFARISFDIVVMASIRATPICPRKPMPILTACARCSKD